MDERQHPNGKAVQIAKLEVHMEVVEKGLDDIKCLLKNKYVTKSEFEPIRRVVFGVVALALTGVFSALLSLIITT